MEEAYVIKSDTERPVYVLALYANKEHTERSYVYCDNLGELEDHLASFKIWPAKNEVPEEFKIRGYVPLSKQEFGTIKKGLESKLPQNS